MVPLSMLGSQCWRFYSTFYYVRFVAHIQLLTCTSEGLQALLLIPFPFHIFPVWKP